MIMHLTPHPQSGLNPATYPVNAGTCQPIQPWDFAGVNTIFQVIHHAGLRTAWSDKHAIYTSFNGPGSNGRSIDDFFGPEIDSQAVEPNGVPYPVDDSWTAGNAATKQYNSYRVQAVINWINGYGHSGTGPKVGTPAPARGSRRSARPLPTMSSHASLVEDRLHLLELLRESPPCSGAGKGEEQLAQATGLDLERDRQARPPAAIERLDRASRDAGQRPADTPVGELTRGVQLDKLLGRRHLPGAHPMQDRSLRPHGERGWVLAVRRDDRGVPLGVVQRFKQVREDVFRSPRNLDAFHSSGHRASLRSR